MRVGRGCLVGGLPRSPVTLRFGEQPGKLCATTGGIFGGFFLRSIFPREDLWYSSESQETQFLVSLLLPGLGRLQTVNGAKQKQTGPGVGPHKRQREGKE
ncbi:hypothetical protein D623_10017586 [Myotis brandtii]|uniref:Uncharacterized protein n=1 Tax=Myotis brandtii TaxID=109478 RepID=S7Q581_MYOBR|nr:hypothetical protein D623_10017586 [Myotis brandtii]